MRRRSAGGAASRGPAHGRLRVRSQLAEDDLEVVADQRGKGEAAAGGDERVVPVARGVDGPRRRVDLDLGRLGRRGEQIARGGGDAGGTGDRFTVGREDGDGTDVGRHLAQVVDGQRGGQAGLLWRGGGRGHLRWARI